MKRIPPALRDSSDNQAAADSNAETHRNHRTSLSDLGQKHLAPHGGPGADIRVQGVMTLEQVSCQYGIPMISILSGLKIKEPVRPTETLGRMMKRYPFHMTDVEEVIRRLKNNTVP